jgi:hypothetical protein
MPVLVAVPMIMGMIVPAAAIITMIVIVLLVMMGVLMMGVGMPVRVMGMIVS